MSNAVELINALRVAERRSGREISALCREAADEIECQMQLLDERDNFLVSRGMWFDFVEHIDQQEKS